MSGRTRHGDGPATDRASQVLRGHTGGVFGVAFSPDGTKLASAGKDGTARVWDLAGQPPQPVIVFRGHDHEVCCVAFHPDGTLIASGGADRMVRIWDASHGPPDAGIPRGRRAASMRSRSVPTGPSSPPVASIARSNIWDAATGELDRRLRRPRRAGYSGRLQRRWNQAGLGQPGRDRQALGPDVRAGRDRRQLGTTSQPAPTDIRWVGGVAFRPAGNELAAAGTNHTIAIWDPRPAG